jgi:hypothetical protein
MLANFERTAALASLIHAKAFHDDRAPVQLIAKTDPSRQ